MNRPAKVTQGEIARAIRAAKQAGADVCVEIKPDGTINFISVETKPPPMSVTPLFSPDQIAAEHAAAERVKVDRLNRKADSIYVAVFDRWVKIGFSTDPAARIIALQAGLPGTLKLVRRFSGSLEDEAALFVRFSEYRVRGEWFENRGILKEWVEAGCPT